MECCIGFPVIRFLVNDEAFCARFDDRNIIRGLHRSDLNRDRRELRRERSDTLAEITLADEFRVLASHEQHMPKTFLREMPPFRHHLLDTERNAEDRIIARKAAVTAIVDALVGKIKRREK